MQNDVACYQIKDASSITLEILLHMRQMIYRDFIGDSANAVPRYQKLCTRDIHIWDIRRGQHTGVQWSASSWENLLRDQGVSCTR